MSMWGTDRITYLRDTLCLLVTGNLENLDLFSSFVLNRQVTMSECLSDEEIKGFPSYVMD